MNRRIHPQNNGEGRGIAPAALVSNYGLNFRMMLAFESFRSTSTVPGGYQVFC